MTWFTETSWPPIVVLLTCGVIWAGVWQQRQRPRYGLWGGIACVVLCGVVWQVERMIVTPREVVRQSVLELTGAFQRGDLEQTLRYISPSALDIIALVHVAHGILELEEDTRVSDVRVAVSTQGTRSTVRFRVNGTVSIKREGWREYQPTRWETKWQLEGEEWKMIGIQELDPITGEELSRFTRLRRQLSRM